MDHGAGNQVQWEFATRWYLNQPAQLQKPAKTLESLDGKKKLLNFSKNEKQGRWSPCADAQADLRPCCSNQQKHFCRRCGIFNNSRQTYIFCQVYVYV